MVRILSSIRERVTRLEGKVQAWGLFQLVIGFISVILGIILLLSERREWKVIRDPEFIHTKTVKNNEIILLPKLVHEPVMAEFVTTIVPRRTAIVLVIVGFYLMFMGIILLMGVYQKSARKTSAWLLGVAPLVLTLMYGSLHKLYLVPSSMQFGIVFVLWGILGHPVYSVWKYHRQCRDEEMRADEILKEQ